MTWNSTVDGDWSQADFKAAPWVSGCMTLSHEEVIHVQTVCAEIIAAFEAENGYTPPDNEYVVPEYNKSDWEKCVNGDTYAVIKSYDTTINTLGIDSNGIVQPLEEPTEETPTEPATEEQPITEEAPV